MSQPSNPLRRIEVSYPIPFPQLDLFHKLDIQNVTPRAPGVTVDAPIRILLRAEEVSRLHRRIVGGFELKVAPGYLLSAVDSSQTRQIERGTTARKLWPARVSPAQRWNTPQMSAASKAAGSRAFLTGVTLAPCSGLVRERTSTAVTKPHTCLRVAH
jgi:hypothetical protein